MANVTRVTRGTSLARANCKEKGVVEYIASAILYALDTSEKQYDKVIFFNIGTDRCTGDALAPMLGTFLSEKKLHHSIEINGTMKSPNHALTLEDNYAKLDTINSFIIGVDACLGDECEIGDIMLRSTGIKAGAGVNKSLGTQGDIGLLGITAYEDGFEALKQVRLSIVWDMCKVLEKVIMRVSKELIKRDMKSTENVIQFDKEVV